MFRDTFTRNLPRTAKVKKGADYNARDKARNRPTRQMVNNDLRAALLEVFHGECDEREMHTRQMWDVLYTIWQAEADAHYKQMEIDEAWYLNNTYANHPLNLTGRFDTLNQVEEQHNDDCDRSEREYWESVREAEAA